MNNNLSLSLLNQNDLHILSHKLKWCNVFKAGCFSIPYSESIDVLVYKKKKGPFFMLVKAFAADNLDYETHT